MEVHDEKEIALIIGDMYLLEVLWRGKGNEKEAERMMDLRLRLRKSLGIEIKFKEEN